MSDVTFPPLMSGEAVTGATNPFETACLRAAMGCDAGLVVYNLGASTLSAALVFAPEVSLTKAVAMLPVCGVGFQNALGALAPPEIAVHLEWAGGIRINGASCGQFRMMADPIDGDAQPDWLVVGFVLPLWPDSEDTGYTPDRTALFAEGCADVQAPALLESWARHTLHWISRWEEDGAAALHSEWRGLAHNMGEEVRQGDLTSTFVGVDEDFGLLLRDAQTTHLIPLSTLLEAP